MRIIQRIVRKYSVTATVRKLFAGNTSDLLERFLRADDYAAIIDRQIDFLVQGKRSIIEVGAADRRPDAIDDYGLSVHERGLVLENLNTSEKKGTIVAAARGVSELTVY